LKITRKLVNSHTDARSSWRAATDKLQPLLNAAARLIVSDMRKLMWPVSDIFVQPGVITSLCLDTVSARMGVRDSLLPAQLPGTHWAMICVIRRLALTVSDVCLKLGCFQST